MNPLDRSQPIDRELGADDFAYHDARDVVRFAETGPLLTGRANCESWHLDRDGRYVCGTNGTHRDSLASWAADPARLVRTFLDFRTRGTCSPRWVFVDEREDDGCDDDEPAGIPGEADVADFLRLRAQLEVVGLTLMDAVIFDQREHWWSMCELLTGSTQWGRNRFPSIELDERSVAR